MYISKSNIIFTISASSNPKIKTCKTKSKISNYEINNTFNNKKIIKIYPRSNIQAKYIELLDSEKPYILVASGSAGTGKTMLATQVGINNLYKGNIEKIIITRPAISIDEEHGFLPGNLEQKMEPWIRPILDVLMKTYSSCEIKSMMKEKIIEICPIAYMRGRTFDNSWIICDEAQNCTPNQILMIATRIGNNSKLIITGDPLQHDRGFNNNGLSDLINKIKIKNEDENEDEDEISDISYIEFGIENVVRHPIIPIILKMYK